MTDTDEKVFNDMVAKLMERGISKIDAMEIASFELGGPDNIVKTKIGEKK